MILDYHQMTSNDPFGRDVFHGVLQDPEQNWESRMPNDLGKLANKIETNPATVLMGLPASELNLLKTKAGAGQLNELKKAVQRAFEGSVADTQLFDVVTASRELVGMTVKTVGMLSSSFGSVRNLFRQEVSAATRVLDFVSSEMFGRALDMLGLIPVVGWIIKIVVEVAQLVTKMVTMVLDERLESAVYKAASQLSVPMSGMDFTRDGDQEFVRGIYGRMRLYTQQEFIHPAYIGKRDKFEVFGVYTGSGGGNWTGADRNKMGVGWVLQPGSALGGTGFVPGTGNIAQSLFFPAGVKPAPPGLQHGLTGYGGSVRDLGSLYPTGMGVLNQWWSMVLKPGPSMFSVNAKAPISDWEDSIYNLLVFGPDVLKGWTKAPTGIPFTNKFYCTEGMMDPYNKKKRGIGECRKSKRGKTLELPGNFGQAAHTSTMGYLYELYFGLKKLGDRDKNFNPDLGVGIPTAGKKAYYTDASGYKWLNPDSIDISKSVPVRALENLYERQMATLKSINCMYVDGEKDNRHKFPAFNSRRLRNQWYESVTAIMSGSDWRQVVLDDVPESRMKNELIQLIKKKGLDPNNFNKPCPPGAPMSHPCRQMRIRAAPTALGDPELPAPPGSNRVLGVHAMPAKKKTGRRKKKGPSGTIVAAAAVGAFFLLRK